MGALLSVPLSTLYVGALRGRGAALYRTLGRVPYARGVASRLGLLSRVALTPEDMPIGAALEAVTIAVGEGSNCSTSRSIRRRSSPAIRPMSATPPICARSMTGGRRC
ncbi:hypothetical protein QP185_16395 [Sphingomonas aerolata]|uniref:hypothetical protein n=1 Tax=Sphingomonas aerolata TaxID=185951 RepID=UPI002FE25BCD